MKRQLYIDNYIIDKPIIDILYDVQRLLTNGKLKDIKPMNDYIMISCPNSEHKNGLEHNPDCGVYVGDDLSKSLGLAHCFACGWVSDFIGVIAECFNSSKEYAKQWLIKKYGVLAKEKINLDDNIDISKNRIIKQKVKDISVLNKYQSYCPYLAQRKVSRQIAEKFLVKYDNKNRQIIFPSFDEKGNLVAINKRNIDYKFFVLDKDSPKVVYGLDHVIKENIKEVVITEGQFDVLCSWSFGQPAISTLGGISNEQIEKINSSCISSVILAMDNDEAGRNFTKELKKKLSKRILVSEVIIPKEFKDVADLDSETFKKIINAAKNS